MKREKMEKYLENHGYTGLLHPEGKCGCNLVYLMICEVHNGDNLNCRPGYRVRCNPNDKECAEHGYSWHIQLEKPVPGSSPEGGE